MRNVEIFGGVTALAMLVTGCAGGGQETNGFSPKIDGSTKSAEAAASDPKCVVSPDIQKKIDNGESLDKSRVSAVCDYSGDPTDYSYYAALTDEGFPTGDIKDQMFDVNGNVVGYHEHEVQPDNSKCGGYGKTCMFNHFKWTNTQSKVTSPVQNTVFKRSNRGHGQSFVNNPGSPRRA